MANSDPLAGEPFSFLSRADGSIVIHYHAAPVTLLRGKAAARFTTRLLGADAAAAQQLMARATGNFKRAGTRGSPLDRSIQRAQATRFVFLDT